MCSRARVIYDERNVEARRHFARASPAPETMLIDVAQARARST